jgi:hypothetical protein
VWKARKKKISGRRKKAEVGERKQIKSPGINGVFQKTQRVKLEQSNKAKQDNPSPLFEGMFRTAWGVSTGVCCF